MDGRAKSGPRIVGQHSGDQCSREATPSGLQDRAGREWWSPKVPNGNATAHMTWKRCCFVQAHIGVFGAHRLEEKKFKVLRRVVCWKDMKGDADFWVSKCLTLRLRKFEKTDDGAYPADLEGITQFLKVRPRILQIAMLVQLRRG